MTAWEVAADIARRKQTLPSTTRLTTLWSELNHRAIPYDQDHRRLSIHSSSSSSSEEEKPPDTDDEEGKEGKEGKDGENHKEIEEIELEDPEKKDAEDTTHEDDPEKLDDESNHKAPDPTAVVEFKRDEDDLEQIYKELGIRDLDAEEEALKKAEESSEIEIKIGGIPKVALEDIKEELEVNKKNEAKVE